MGNHNETNSHTMTHKKNPKSVYNDLYNDQMIKLKQGKFSNNSNNMSHVLGLGSDSTAKK